MSEQQMPARIRIDGDDIVIWSPQLREHGVFYTRSDIAERMAEALEKTALVCSGDSMSKRGLIDALESARSALSAFKDSAQDRGAS